MYRISIPPIGTDIYAHIVFAGMVIETEAGERIEVQEITEGYDSWTFGNGWGRAATVPYGDRVRLLGYFNPDPA